MPGLEEQYQTHVMVRKKNARGEGCHAHPFEAIMRPLMSVMKTKLFSDHFFFQAVFFCLFLSKLCLFNGLESLLQETCYRF